MKLKCFTCGTRFEKKEDVFRDSKNYPICETCLIEFMEVDWAYEFVEFTIDNIKNKFNRSHNKWEKWFFENHTECNGEHDDYDPYYEENDSITEIKGKKYCRVCIEEVKVYTS